MYTKAKTTTYMMRNVYIFWSLVALLCVSIFMYAYFVNVTIFHTAQRQTIEDQLVDTRSAISKLEITLIDAHRNVTKSYAHALGFTDTDNLVFVERASAVSLAHEIQR